nr:MAG TPA: hypothetical protein [Bacteriophage sp.]
MYMVVDILGRDVLFDASRFFFFFVRYYEC